VTLLTYFSANEDFFAVFWTRLTNVLVDVRANIKQQTRTVGPFQELMFSVYVWQRNELSTSHRGDPPTRLGCLRSRQREVRLTMNKLWKYGRIVKTLCTYFQFKSIKCIIYFQYNSVKIVSFLFYFPFPFIQMGSCSSQPLVSFCPFIVCFLLFYKTYL